MKKIALSRSGLVFVSALLFFLALPIFSASASDPFKGKISIVFDDGARNIFTNAMPVLTLHGIKATIYPVVSEVESKDFWTVSWRQLKILNQLGWEVGSHTMTHPYLTQLSDVDLDKELKDSKQILTSHGFNVKSLAFPFGDYNERVIDFSSRYYETTRRAWGNYGLNTFPYMPYELVSREVSSTTKPEEVYTWINEAMNNNQWLVLLFHEVVLTKPVEYQYSRADFRKIADYIKKNNVSTVTVSEALNYNLGTNLIENPNFTDLDETGWSMPWQRSDEANIVLEPVDVGRVFTSGNWLKMVGGIDQHSLYTKAIDLPDVNKKYLFSMFAVTKDVNAFGVGTYLNEYDGNGAWLGGKWLGGIYSNYFGVKNYVYQPVNPSATKVILEIFTDPNSDLKFYSDNFYFGTIN